MTVEMEVSADSGGSLGVCSWVSSLQATKEIVNKRSKIKNAFLSPIKTTS